MSSRAPGYPDHRDLQVSIASIFAEQHLHCQYVSIIDRRPNSEASTFPSEIVTCRCHDNHQIRLLCKYTAGLNPGQHSHSSIDYEGTVYRQILQPLGVSVPMFYGVWQSPATAQRWLLLGYLDGAESVDSASDESAIILAARWIGRFHETATRYLERHPQSFLRAYSVPYFRRMARLTAQNCGHLIERYPWLRLLCRRFEQEVGSWLTGARTLIHAEYYPANILYRDRQIWPVDWETAGIGPGEIDVASITEGWPSDVSKECEREYQAARWPDGPPPDFSRRLDTARLGMVFHWLGRHQDWAKDPDPLYFEQLQSVGLRLGLISLP